MQVLVRDGQVCQPGTILALLNGPARSLLSAERVALNFLQHLCGVATLTAKCVAKAEGTACQILDTRKTILGLRSLQKYAVKSGGGTNHRFHLGDRILIKNNHLALASLGDCIRRARSQFPLGWIEVEIDSINQLEDAISTGVNATLLDNMSPEQVRECVVLARKRVYLEASGGITLDNLASYAATGVDGISIGALTHSAPAVDMSMRIA
jgi:nicotinate-nucleotide pyrophosphorylase (carboxylating)